ncbi:hypothetical protein J3R83DRAFT_2979 [Lanmaoa asiatica]|nr:hypothetical protein J3R83DRAFT_2979 [Lanmaoa asiatica]
MPLFFAGKLRIRGGGDLFHTRTVSRRLATSKRRNCYIKYEVVLEARNGNLVHQTDHGELEKIFVLTLPMDRFFGLLSGKTLALALVTPWVTTEVTKGTFKNIYMASERASIVTDVRS